MCIWTFSNITDYINTTFRKQTAFLFWCIWRRQQSALETSCFCSQWRWQKTKHTTAISRKLVILCQWSYIDWVKKCFWFHNRKHNGMPHTKVVSVSKPRHHKWSDPFRFSNQNIILHLPGAFFLLYLITLTTLGEGHKLAHWFSRFDLSQNKRLPNFVSWYDPSFDPPLAVTMETADC